LFMTRPFFCTVALSPVCRSVYSPAIRDPLHYFSFFSPFFCCWSQMISLFAYRRRLSLEDRTFAPQVLPGGVTLSLLVIRVLSRGEVRPSPSSPSRPRSNGLADHTHLERNFWVKTEKPMFSFSADWLAPHESRKHPSVREFVPLFSPSKWNGFERCYVSPPFKPTGSGFVYVWEPPPALVAVPPAFRLRFFCTSVT